MTTTASLESRDANEVDAAAMGARVRSLRHGLGLSAGELAVRAGLSIGLISQIERGQGNPSLRTLERLRVALNVPLMRLLEGPKSNGSEASFIRRRHARPRILVGTDGLTKEVLSPPETEGLRILILTVPPKSRSREMVIGPGQKAGLVLSGLIRIVVGSEEGQLAEGDSFQFPSHKQHAFINDTERPAEILWIMQGPEHETQV
ncbi:helix-turn-helix domain-containing protein [uncultured Enterovirga sp.]|uniref:helix-turn-helix domain-containing protein n=1 Tax=uncultured Enterovirga sp. TaxID=2026352 RepID=UPI0035C9B79A